MTRPHATYDMNGDVILSTEISGLIVSMRMKPNVADELATALNVMAEHARRVESKGVKLHKLIDGFAEIAQQAMPVDFDAKQIKERNSGVPVAEVPARNQVRVFPSNSPGGRREDENDG